MYSIPTWTEENRSLFDAICQARVSVEAAQDLQHHLQLNRQKFIDLLDTEPKNATHRATLNSNKAYINRNLHNVSKNFVTKALFLSDQLELNEHVAATLLMRGTTEANRVSSNSIDAAVILYHSERGYLLACLDAILKSAKDVSISEEVRLICYQFMEGIIQQSVAPDGNFVAKLISTLKTLGENIKAIQNTGTIAGMVPEAGSGKLGENISELRIERLREERISIVQILYHIASLYEITTEDKTTVLELLEEAELSDPATAYAIIAMIAALQLENQKEEETPNSATMDFIKSFHNRLMTRGSKVPVIKAVVVLQWILYLSNPVRANAVIGVESTKVVERDVQDLLDHAVATDVFGFMNQYLLYFQQVNAMIDTGRKVIKYEDNRDSNSNKKVDTSDYHNFNADIRNDFHPFVIHEIEKLAVSFITIESNYLTSLKYKEEDTNIPVQTPLTTDNAICSAGNKEQCRDLEYFLTFLASVYRDRVNAGIIFWSRGQGGLHSFARWLLDVKVVSTVCAAFDFFGSISTGDACALSMYSFFNVGVVADLKSCPLFSWGRPFSALEFYANLLKDESDESNAIIPDVEEQLILKFLSILKQTAQYSKEARTYFWYNTTFRYRFILFDIIGRPTSIQLRAALFDVLSTFCSAWGGGVDGLGRDICIDVWSFLEDSDMLLPKRQMEKDKARVTYKPAGLLQELEQEKASRVFTETLSVIRLIGSAIHTQSKREALVSGFQAPIPSIPLNFGKGTKSPGAAPFITLVIDEIFVNLGSQQYAFAEGKWQLTEACLMVMENSVESFDIIDLENEALQDQWNKALQLMSTSPEIQSQLLQYLTHPGFQVIIRILAGGRLVTEIFNVIEECAKKETKEVENMPYHKQCLVRALRVLLRVLNLQTTFCGILIPYIAKFSKRKTSTEFQLGEYTFAPLPSAVSLGQLILFHSLILERLALLINYEDQEEICFLSTKIMHGLSVDYKKSEGIEKLKSLTNVTSSSTLTSLGSNLTNILSTSKSAEAIIFGVSERLSLSLAEVTTCDDYEYDTDNIPFWLAEETLNNTYSYPSDFQPRLSSSVPIAILDLLLENAQQEKTPPTLTEFLLGYNLSRSNSVNKIQDTEANRATLVCFHAILDMMRQGVEKSQALTDAMIEDTAEATLPLIDTHPILAEKCYQLIYRLCANQSLSLPTMRYLRNRENFFYKQFDLMSSRLEYNIAVESPTFSGTMICADGTQIQTDFFKLRSKLHQRAWILHCIALELHTTIGMRQKSETTKLLELLYGRKNVRSDNDMDTFDQQEVNLFSVNSPFQQPLVKMLELVSSLEFTWKDDLMKAVQVTELKYWNGFDVSFHEYTNERGCHVYDVRKIYQVLRGVQELKYTGTEHNDGAETEMGSILNWCMAENHAREIAHGKLQCLKAWKEVIHITLIECFALMGVETREHMIHELLQMLLTKIMYTKDYNGQMLKSMSELVSALIHRLGKDSRSRPASQLPIEKLKLIFSGIVGSIRRQETSFEVRGDLYTAMTGFLLYINGHGRDEVYTQLEKYIVDYITSQNSKLLDTLCADATHGLGIWKTTAFIGLDALNKAALRTGSDAVQNFLIEKNFLQYTIEMIRSDDAALTNLLEQTDAALLPLYIFEAKMSILLSLATNPEGAELLYSNRIFEVLGQCQFMKAQQQEFGSTQMNIDNSSELSARYQRLLVPTLSLVVALLCCYDGKNDSVLKRAEGWVRRQQAALVGILKDERRPTTMASLENVKLVTTIMYMISCRSGYLDDLANRGINQIHNTMCQLVIPEATIGSVIPVTSEEQELDSSLDTATGGALSMFNTKVNRSISFIKKALDSYKSQK